MGLQGADERCCDFVLSLFYVLHKLANFNDAINIEVGWLLYGAIYLIIITGLGEGDHMGWLPREHLHM